MKVYVVCSQNICRSPMAEMLIERELRKRQIDGISVYSCGLWAPEGAPASQGAVNVMLKRGLSLSWHRSRRMHASLVEKDTIFLAVTQEYKDYLIQHFPGIRAYTLAEFAGVGTDVEDPFGKSIQVYEQTAALLETMAKGVAERFSVLLRLSE